MNIQQTLHWLSQQLPPEEAALEAELMLARACALTRTQLRTYPDKGVTEQQLQRLKDWLAQRQQGVPLAYIFGDSEFYGLTLQVNQHTLIPRQDTELLVDTALALMDRDTRYQLLDLGTGSGAIAIAIAHHRPKAQVTAVDQSVAALSLAQDNACALRLPHIRFIHSNWFSQLDGKQFDIIVSNPPYLAEGDPHLQETSLPYEPITALTSGTDGLDDIRTLINKAPTYLYPNGWLLIEHGYNQASEVHHLFQQAGFINISTKQDYGHNDRLTMAQWSAIE